MTKQNLEAILSKSCSHADEYEMQLASSISSNIEQKIFSKSDLTLKSESYSYSGLELIYRISEFNIVTQGVINKDIIGFDFPLHRNGVVSKRKVLSNKDQLFYIKGTELNLFCPSGERLILIIDRKLIKKYLHLTEFSSFKKIQEWFDKNEVSFDSKKKLTKALLIEFKKLKRLSKSDFNKVAANDCIDNIMLSLIDYINENAVYINPSENNNKQRVLAKSLEYISTADIDKLTLQDLSDNTYASVRTIQYAFSDEFYISPKKYIIFERLNRIRKDLLNADPKKEKVSQVIKKYGVVNFGRFRNDYYQMFQEYPKDTLIK